MNHADRDDPTAESIVQHGARRSDPLIRGLLEQGSSRCRSMGGRAQRLPDWLAAGVRRRLREPRGDGLDGASLLPEIRGLPARWVSQK